MTLSLRPARLRRSPLAALPLLLGLASALHCQPAAAQGALFGAAELEQQRFILVAAPIGSSGNRYQLNIYEQINDRRPCFAAASGLPSPVNPLLATFDFTGICGRYIDANGYSLRVGGSDLATSYRLLVRSDPAGTLLVALPTKAGAGPEMIVARSGGLISGFHKLQPEPGWRLMRRTFGGRRLGHLYVYSESWPAAPGDPAASPAPAGSATMPSAPAMPSMPGASGSGLSAPPTPQPAGRPQPAVTPISGTPAAGSRPAAPATSSSGGGHQSSPAPMPPRL